MKGRLGIFHLLVLISLDQLLLYRKYYLLFYKTSYLNEEVNCSEPSSLLEFPGAREEHESGKRRAKNYQKRKRIG